MGQRTGIDRDEDGFLDRDEIDRGSDPADPTSIPCAAAPAKPGPRYDKPGRFVGTPRTPAPVSCPLPPVPPGSPSGAFLEPRS